MRLEWDARKGRENLRKHGVSFEEASSVFLDRKRTRLNSSHSQISYGAFCLKKKYEQNAHSVADLLQLGALATVPSRASQSHHCPPEHDPTADVAQYSNQLGEPTRYLLVTAD